MCSSCMMKAADGSTMLNQTDFNKKIGILGSAYKNADGDSTEVFKKVFNLVDMFKPKPTTAVADSSGTSVQVGVVEPEKPEKNWILIIALSLVALIVLVYAYKNMQ